MSGVLLDSGAALGGPVEVSAGVSADAWPYAAGGSAGQFSPMTDPGTLHGGIIGGRPFAAVVPGDPETAARSVATAQRLGLGPVVSAGGFLSGNPALGLSASGLPSLFRSIPTAAWVLLGAVLLLRR